MVYAKGRFSAIFKIWTVSLLLWYYSVLLTFVWSHIVQVPLRFAFVDFYVRQRRTFESYFKLIDDKQLLLVLQTVGKFFLCVQSPPPAILQPA